MRLLEACRPAGLGWRLVGPVVVGGQQSDLWFHAGTDTQVLSALVHAELPRSGKIGPQWLVSVTSRSAQMAPRRPSPAQVRLALCAFDMLHAEEDNHHPGASRHYFMPVDSSERVDCECKTTETIVEERDGYQWSNANDGPCRGCELERLMAAGGVRRPCPIHSSKSAEAAR